MLNRSGDKVSETELPDEIFSIPVKKSILHDVVRMQLLGKRKGTAVTKGRSDVIGSTKKLYRQKGTGNARSGDIKSPLRKGGGVIFGPSQRSYAIKMPKKVRRLALKMALSSKLQNSELFVINEFDLDSVKTRDFVTVLDQLGFDNLLIITDKDDRNIQLSSRNVPSVKVLRTDGLNVYDILKYNKLLLVESSIEAIKGRLA